MPRPGRPPRTSPTRPTDRELEILAVVWDSGPITVRAVHQALEQDLGIGQTTVLKLMQIMVEKGLLEKDEDVRPQQFRAARTQRQTQRQLVRDLLDRAFGGSSGSLVMQAMAARRLSGDDRQRVRELLDNLDAESGE